MLQLEKSTDIMPDIIVSFVRMLLRGGLPSDDPVDVREGALGDLKSLSLL